MLEEVTTHEQRRQPKYKVKTDKKTGEVQITSEQRSWINARFFKNFGDSRVAYFILNHGLPAIMDVPLRRNAPTKAMFQNMLEELMTWHASLLQSLLQRQKHPDMEHARRLSALDERKWQLQRRTQKYKAKQRLDEGIRLIKQRDSGKRKFEDMSATEQRIVEDCYTGKAHKEHAKVSGEKLPQFKGKLLLPRVL